jgi:quinol monooxygenase YgiN
MTKVALYVELIAKPGKSHAVADFLRGAQPLVDGEPGTIAWFAVQLDTDRFAIFDAFNDEAGRAAHLSGPVAAALMSKAEELFAAPPAIHQVQVLADKISGS